MNKAFSRALLKLLYLDDTKIGRMFIDMYSDAIPDPAVAVLGAAVSYSLCVPNSLVIMF